MMTSMIKAKKQIHKLKMLVDSESEQKERGDRKQPVRWYSELKEKKESEVK